MYDIDTIDALVDYLGGDCEVAEWLGISQPAVANWKIRGQVAAGWHLRIYARLCREGATVNPLVFGLSREEARGLSRRRLRRRPPKSKRQNAGVEVAA